MTFDVRNLPTLPEGLGRGHSPNYTGNIFFGDGGFMVVDPDGFQVYKSAAADIKGEAAHGAGAGKAEKYEKTMDEKAQEREIWATNPHMQNFFDAVRARDHKLLHADIAIGTHSADFVHMANIAYAWAVLCMWSSRQNGSERRRSERTANEGLSRAIRGASAGVMLTDRRELLTF